MKPKAVAAVLALALLGASIAAAAPADKGKRGDGTAETTTTSSKKGPKGDAVLLGCERVRDVELGGLFVSGTAGVSGGTGSFAMLVTRGNKPAKSLKGKQVTVMTTEKTVVRRRGHATLADLVAGDRLRVHARTCRTAKGEAEPAVPKFLARKVDAKPAKPGGTTTGTTTTT